MISKMKGICLAFFLMQQMGSWAQLRVIHRIHPVAGAGILYGGIRNELEVSGVPDPEVLTVTSSARSTISRKGKSLEVVPSIREGRDTLRFYAGSSLLQTLVYRILPVADPFVQLAYSTDTLLPAGRILANPVLRVWFPDTAIRNPWRILSFACTVKRKHANALYYKTNGNRMSDEMLAAVRTMRPGDVLQLEEIRAAAAADAPARLMAPVAITIQ